MKTTKKWFKFHNLFEKELGDRKIVLNQASLKRHLPEHWEEVLSFAVKERLRGEKYDWFSLREDYMWNCTQFGQTFQWVKTKWHEFCVDNNNTGVELVESFDQPNLTTHLKVVPKPWAWTEFYLHKTSRGSRILDLRIPEGLHPSVPRFWKFDLENQFLARGILSVLLFLDLEREKDLFLSRKQSPLEPKLRVHL